MLTRGTMGVRHPRPDTRRPARRPGAGQSIEREGHTGRTRSLEAGLVTEVQLNGAFGRRDRTGTAMVTDMLDKKMFSSRCYVLPSAKIKYIYKAIRIKYRTISQHHIRASTSFLLQLAIVRSQRAYCCIDCTFRSIKNAGRCCASFSGSGGSLPPPARPAGPQWRPAPVGGPAADPPPPAMNIKSAGAATAGRERSPGAGGRCSPHYKTSHHHHRAAGEDAQNWPPAPGALPTGQRGRTALWVSGG